MPRKLALAFFLCFAAMTGFAQSSLNGKWATARPDPLAATDGQRRQGVQLEVTIEDARASGSFTIGGLGGRFYTFKDGRLSGNKVQFRTWETAQPTPVTTWTLELVDENTATLSRGPLELVGSNGLDLIAVMGAVRPTPASQVAADTNLPVISAATQEPSIIGIVQDRSRARIPGVKVTVRNMDTGLESATTTDEAGVYRFPGVASGPYTITASLPGFDTATASNLNIGSTQSRQDFTLEIRQAPASANSQGGYCNANGIAWCAGLHRAK